MKLRWIAFGLLSLTSGGVCYWCYAHHDAEKLIGILAMTAMTMFFYAGDAHVDELFAQDVKKAQREANS